MILQCIRRVEKCCKCVRGITRFAILAPRITFYGSSSPANELSTGCNFFLNFSLSTQIASCKKWTHREKWTSGHTGHRKRRKKINTFTHGANESQLLPLSGTPEEPQKGQVKQVDRWNKCQVKSQVALTVFSFLSQIDFAYCLTEGPLATRSTVWHMWQRERERERERP